MITSDSFIAHLIELRTRLLHSFVALIVVFICLFPWAADLYALLARPLLLGQVPEHIALHALVLLAYGAAGFYAAALLLRRRMLR